MFFYTTTKKRKKILFEIEPFVLHNLLKTPCLFTFKILNNYILLKVYYFNKKI